MTVKAGQKCTAIRRIIVPAPMADAGHRGDRARDWPRSPSATRRNEPCAWVPLASLDQRDEVRKAVQALRGSSDDRLRRPELGRGRSTPTPSAARSCPPSCCARAPGAAEPHDVEAFGPVATVIDLLPASTKRSHSPPAGRAAWPARWSPTTRPSPARSPLGSRPGTAGSSSSTATTPASRPATGHRCQSSCTAVPDGPVAVRNSAGSAASCTICSARPFRPRPTC